VKDVSQMPTYCGWSCQTPRCQSIRSVKGLQLEGSPRTWALRVISRGYGLAWAKKLGEACVQADCFTAEDVL